MDLARGGYTDKQIRDALHGRGGRQKYRYRYELQQGGARICDLDVSEAEVSLDRDADIQRTASLVVYNGGINWLVSQIKIYMGVWVPAPVEGKRIDLSTWADIDALNAPWSTIDGAITWLDIDRGYCLSKPQYAGAWVEWPLGVFIPSTPKKVTDAVYTERKYLCTVTGCAFWGTPWDTLGAYTWAELEAGPQAQRKAESETLMESAHWELECYDLTVILREDAYTDRYFVAAGTKYLDAIQNVLVGAGFERMLVTRETDVTVPADREWDIGTSKLQIVNQLLAEINYNRIYADADGNLIISPYMEPGPDTVKYTYAADAMSIIGQEVTAETDYYSVPNVFIALSSNPDVKQDYRSVYTNNNPASRLSTVQRGRTIVSKPYKLDMVASQDELDNYIYRMAFEASQVYETVDFETALMPIHGSGDVLSLDHPAMSGIYQELAWTMELTGEGRMTHTVRRLAMI